MKYNKTSLNSLIKHYRVNRFTPLRLALLSVCLLCLALAILPIGRSTADSTAPFRKWGQRSQDGIWRTIDEKSINVLGERTIQPRAYQTVQLNESALRLLLQKLLWSLPRHHATAKSS